MNTLQKLMRIAERLLNGQDFLRLPHHPVALVPVRITATAHNRRTRRPKASTAFVSTAR